MAKYHIQPVLDWLKRVITQPQSELTRWQMTVRFAYDLGRYGAVQLRRDRAPQMAAALSFRSLFGLLPVLVVGAVMVRAFRGRDEFIAMLDSIMAGLGLYQIGPSGNTLGELLSGLVSQAADFNFTAIGWVGVAVLVYSAISLMATIENGFNIIYRAPEGRSPIKRIQVYWFVLTVGPLAIAATIYVNSRVEMWIHSVETWQWLIAGAVNTWTFLTTWLIMLVGYALIPNTNIAMRPAMIGAVVATVLLAIGKHVLGVYLENAVSISQLYGSLGLIPLFMFWVYLMWLVILFGLEVSATLQMLHGRTLDKIKQRQAQTGLIDPASVISVMEVIAQRFGQALPTSASLLREETSIPRFALDKMLERLVENGLIHRLDREEASFSLARPPEQISAEQVINLGFSLADETGSGRQSLLMERLRVAQRTLVAQATLATLMGASAAIASEDQVASS